MRQSGRRSLIALTASVLVWPSLAFADEATRARRTVAYLSPTSLKSSGRLLEQLSSGLRDHGWIEGANLIIHTRFADGDPERYGPLTTELLALRPDIFVVGPERSALAAVGSNSKLPIVFILGDDPVGLGLVESLARPGRNITGFSVLNFEINVKRLTLLKDAIPNLTKVGVLFRGSDGSITNNLRALEQGGKALGIELVGVSVNSGADIPGAIGTIAASGAGGLMNIPDALFFTERNQVAEHSKRHRLAAVSGAIESVEAGTLLAYSADFAAMHRRAADLVDRILRGADPATIPVEQASIFELVINLKTARTLGIQLPRSLLLQATRLIE